MKLRLFKVALPAALALVGAFSTPARANQVECRIPFSFAVNGKTMPAGTYHVSTEGTARSLLLIRGLRDGVFALGMRTQSRMDTAAKLVFHKYGDEYVLRQVWMGDGSGREMPESALERRLMERTRRAAVTVEMFATSAL